MNVLPGWFPAGAFAAAAASVLTALVQVNSANSTAATITAPANIQPGDLLVLWQSAANIGSPPTLVQPTGFTTISNQPAGGTRFNMCYKIADGTEDGATLTGMDASAAGSDAKSLLQFRGNIPITSVSVVDLETQFTLGNPTSQTVNASGGQAPLIVLAGYDSTNAIDPRTFTPAKDGEINSGVNHYFAWKIYNSSPADVTVDMDDEGDNALHTYYLACS